MTSATSTQITTSRATLVEPVGERPRFRLKPQGPTTGFVDGAWWPRSRDLAAELPALLAVLMVRMGRIERVSYNLTTWAPTVRKIHVGGVVVRLAGYRSQHPDTVDVLSARHLTTLLVVPDQTAPETAHRILMTAAHRGNTDRIPDLLACASPSPSSARAPDGEQEAALWRWERDGGSTRVGE
ncbi:DUF5994 family protein [Pseudonocardia eucalypti]|uniref:DUF5994 family protein n=1 Tax=Pseudonocardia eucalypti TaxID=648755 RepID=A0ABP9QH94_9PSEU|nr:hypothetical protein [Pseudonocardia eucalypti]